MRFIPSIMTSLLKDIDRRAFKAIVKRHDGDAYGSFLARLGSVRNDSANRGEADSNAAGLFTGQRLFIDR